MLPPASPHPDPASLTRREFVRDTTLAAGALGLSLPLVSARPAVAADPPPLARRVLGRTGLEVTTMTLGAAPCGIASDVTVAEVADIVNLALDLGINFIDTAPRYGKSEEGIGQALGARRKDVHLGTKIWADTVEEAEKSLAGSLRTLRTDHVEVLYFHHLGDRQVERARDPEGVFTWMLKQKQAGKCRFVGLSGHNLPARFLPFLESGEVDVILVALNFVDRHTYNFEEKVLPLARRHNVGIVAMKVFGGPDPESGSWGTRKAKPMIGVERLPLAIRYALSLSGVATANLGVHTADQLRQNVEWVRRFEPLPATELAAALDQGKTLAAQWGEHFGPAA